MFVALALSWRLVTVGLGHAGRVSGGALVDLEVETTSSATPKFWYKALATIVMTWVLPRTGTITLSQDLSEDPTYPSIWRGRVAAELTPPITLHNGISGDISGCGRPAPCRSSSFHAA